MSTDLEAFYACMDYRPCDRRPNHELGVWQQTKARWQEEAPAAVRDFTWDWFSGEDALGLDRREFVPMRYNFLPPFTTEVLEDTPEYEVIRNGKGIVTRALKAGTVGGQRMTMDTYLDFPVKNLADFRRVKERLVATAPERRLADLDARAAVWARRQWPLVLGHNCAANGFYWRAREFMGTEALSLAWYDQPELMHEMMAFYADFIIEVSRPVLERVRVDYFCLNEDFAMKGGTLLGPATFRRFVFPHLKRLVDFFRAHGTRHFAVDSDGDPTPLVGLLMDAGVDTLWPLERASSVDPLAVRRRFGRGLRLWGGVDKRILPRGPAAIRAHLREFIPLIEEGGFIPTLDHTFPPEISWDNCRAYFDAKQALLRGDFAKLG